MCHPDIFKVMDVICCCLGWPVVLLTDGSLCKDYQNLQRAYPIFVQRAASHFSFLFFSLWLIFILSELIIISKLPHKQSRHTIVVTLRQANCYVNFVDFTTTAKKERWDKRRLTTLAESFRLSFPADALGGKGTFGLFRKKKKSCCSFFFSLSLRHSRRQLVLDTQQYEFSAMLKSCKLEKHPDRGAVKAKLWKKQQPKKRENQQLTLCSISE